MVWGEIRDRTLAVLALGAVRRHLPAVALIVSQIAASAPASFLSDTNPPSRSASPAELIVGTTPDGLPPLHASVDGQYAGLSADYLAAALGAGHPRFVVRSFINHEALLAAACHGDVDVVPDEPMTSATARCLLFSSPYYEGRMVTVTRADDEAVALPPRAATATYAVDIGSFMAAPLRERLPDAHFLSVPHAQQALEAVAAGRADLYVGVRAAVELAMAQAALPSLSMGTTQTDPLAELRFAFPPNRTALRDAVERGLLAIDDETRTRVLSRWITPEIGEPATLDRMGHAAAPASASISTFAASARTAAASSGASAAPRTTDAADSAPPLVLSDAERAFLARLPPVRAALIVRWPPFSYLDDSGQLTGILPEYLAHITHALGIRVQQIAQPTPGAEGRALALGTADLIIYVSPDLRAMPVPDSTDAVETYPVVIVGPRNAAPVNDLAQLAHKRVAVVERSLNLELLQREAAGAVPVETGSLGASMQLVRDGKADAMIGNLAAIDVLLQKEFAGDLKVLGSTGAQQTIGFQLRPEYGPLVPLIDRALAAMPETERIAIRNHYLTTSYQLGLSWRQIAWRAAPAIAVALVAIGLLALGYARLRREVRRRHATEQELRTQLRFRSTLLDMLPFPIGVRNARGAYLDVNAAAEQAMGLPRLVVLGRTVEECIALPGASGKLASHVLATTGRASMYEGVRIDFQDADGSQRHGLYWHRPFLGERGDIAGTIGAVVDVTAVLEAERKVRETEARLEDVTRNLPAAVFQLRRDADGVLSYPYRGGNAMLLPDLPLDGLARIAESPCALAADDLPRLMAALDDSARTLRPLQAGFRIQADGGAQWLQIHAVPRREADGATLWSGYWSDTTLDRLHTEEIEAARDAAESASRSKDRFVAAMSHEIRTPMSGVLGLVEMLARSPLQGEQATMVGMIHDSAGALLQILDDVLDFSKIEAARLTIEATPLDLRDLCDLALGLLAARAHQKALALRCRVSRDVAALHRGDSVRLRQVLFNLIGNAIKFTDAGSVGLSVAVEHEDAGRQALCIDVTDTGIGVEPATLATLFAPFVQADASTTRRFGGTGLGLAICRQLVQLMGGTIGMASEPGVGTTVTVRLSLPVEQRELHDDVPWGQWCAAVLTRDAAIAASLADAVAARGVRVIAVDEMPAQAGDGLLEHACECADLVFVDDDADVVAEAAFVAGSHADRTDVADVAERADRRHAGRQDPSVHASTAARAVVIRVTTVPEPAGYRLTRDGILVSVNPLSSRGLYTACRAAVQADGARQSTDAASAIASAVPASISGLPGASDDPPQRTREDAVRDGTLILVAEDNPVNRYLLRSQLASLGCACDLAQDGAAALAAYQAGTYAILITDCHMPTLDGFDLARAIRETEQRSGKPRMPIVALTASIDLGERGHCVDAGMDECLRKPASREVLRACLERWVPACLEAAGASLYVAGSVEKVENAGRAGHVGNTGHAESAGRAESAATSVDSVSVTADPTPFDWRPILHSIGGGENADAGDGLIEVVSGNLRDEAQALRELLDDMHVVDVAGLRQWIHRVRGGAAVLRYQPLLDALAEFAARVVPDDAARVQTAGRALVATLDQLSARMARR